MSKSVLSLCLSWDDKEFMVVYVQSIQILCPIVSDPRLDACHTERLDEIQFMDNSV